MYLHVVVHAGHPHRHQDPGTEVTGLLTTTAVPMLYSPRKFTLALSKSGTKLSPGKGLGSEEIQNAGPGRAGRMLHWVPEHNSRDTPSSPTSNGERKVAIFSL